MTPTRPLMAFLLFFAAAGAQAADLALGERDCGEILERWATAPDSVSRALVDACKAEFTEVDPAREAALAGPQLAAADPCSGAEAAGSVLCWGPWATLAPAAAGPPPDAPVVIQTVEDCAMIPQLASACVPAFTVDDPPPPEPPLGVCTPGAPCGFATLVAGVTSSDDPETTRFARFSLAGDGSQFTVSPADDAAIDSVSGMSLTITDRLTDDYETLRATGRVASEQSRLIARMIRNGTGGIQLAADIWSHGDRTTGISQSGYFAWGNATSQAALDGLNTGAVSVAFTGPMSVDNATQATLVVDFGTRPDWSGTWTNPAWSFAAGGVVSGADLISVADRFSSNVVAEGSTVQGALLGEPGQMGIAHLIDVTLTDQRLIRDVGLLREATSGP